MKRSASATARRTVRRAMTWRPKSAGRHDVDVASLISPLRYDVLVRAEFFTFLEQWGDRRPDDGDALVAAAGELPYATWFRSVAMARFRPWVLGDPVLLQQQFRERVLSALALWRSFRGRGFDPTHPVTLRWTAGPLRTDTGLMIDRRLHVGDGGHRLALLLSAGLPLSADLYRVDRRPQRTLIDNTAVLVPALGIAGRGVRAGSSPGATHDTSTAIGELVRGRRSHATPCGPARSPRSSSTIGPSSLGGRACRRNGPPSSARLHRPPGRSARPLGEDRGSPPAGGGGSARPARTGGDGLGKWRWRQAFGMPRGQALPVYVVGLQRSGTNMLMRGLQAAPEVEVHNENDRAVFSRFRLRSDDVLTDVLCASRHQVVLVKPLCDSQRVDELLGSPDLDPAGRCGPTGTSDDRARSEVLEVRRLQPAGVAPHRGGGGRRGLAGAASRRRRGRADRVVRLLPTMSR